MKNIFKIAWRGILRNIRRTLITVITICVSVFVILVIQGFLNGLHQGLIDNITKSRTGDIQIHHPDYMESADSLPLNYTIKDTSKIYKIISSEREVKHVSKRINFAGMVSNGELSSMAIVMGVDPKDEIMVCPKIKNNIIEGYFLRDTKGNVAEAVVASQFVKALKVKKGDILTLLANTKFGALNAIDIEIVGILSDRLPLGNNKLIMIPIKKAQSFLQMENESTEVILSIKKVDRAGIVAQQIRKRLDNSYLFEISSWDALAKVFKDIMNIQSAVFWVIKLVLLVIVISSIINTMLMSVFERIREIGTMMAIGMKRIQILFLFILETLILGVFGAIVGLITAILVILYFNINGFTYTAPGTNFLLSIFPFITIGDILMAFSFSVVASVVSSVYPAFKASSLTPIEALRAI